MIYYFDKWKIKTKCYENSVKGLILKSTIIITVTLKIYN